jgi:RHS repeat-associated protein
VYQTGQDQTLPDFFNWKFTGVERDAETTFDLMAARSNSGAQGRFMSPDTPTVGQDPSDPQSWNLYAYARNNPFKYVDPTGHAFCTWGPNANDDRPEDGGTNHSDCDTNGGTWVFESGDQQAVRNDSGDVSLTNTPYTSVTVNGDTGKVDYVSWWLEGSDIPLSKRATAVLSQVRHNFKWLDPTCSVGGFRYRGKGAEFGSHTLGGHVGAYGVFGFDSESGPGIGVLSEFGIDIKGVHVSVGREIGLAGSSGLGTTWLGFVGAGKVTAFGGVGKSTLEIGVLFGGDSGVGFSAECRPVQ